MAVRCALSALMWPVLCVDPMVTDAVTATTAVKRPCHSWSAECWVKTLYQKWLNRLLEYFTKGQCKCLNIFYFNDKQCKTMNI